MLKVVGASWLQTRISTYILVAVALIGIVAFIIGEYGRVENDGTYSATVWWNHKTAYRVDFWGQSNNLTSLPLGVARAYHKTGIPKTGWSILEIETSPDYEDHQQAYAAGLLEGSLTWQLIYQHWHNTVRAACAPRASLCRKMKKYLRDNLKNVRAKADRRRYDDPFWHMVHLYYVQLDGLKDGWRHAVDSSRQSVYIDENDFLWLAMASDLPDLERANNGTDHHITSDGMIVLKAVYGNDREQQQRQRDKPLLVMAHNTAAPYARMLRLLKRYKFAYRVNPASGSARVPGHSIAMTSYPGALSSQDESYVITEPGREYVVTGTPLIIDNHSLWSRLRAEDLVMSAGRIMAANRLAVDGLGWSRLLDRHNSGTSNRQWIGVEPRNGAVSFVEQIPGFTCHLYRTEEFRANGYLGCTGAPYSRTIRDIVGGARDESVQRAELLESLMINVSSVDDVRYLMSGNVRALKIERRSQNITENLITVSTADEKKVNITENLTIGDAAENEINNSDEFLTDPTTTTTTETRPTAKYDIDTATPASTTTNPCTTATYPPITGNNLPDDLFALEQLLAYRGDLAAVPRPLGVIDSKIFSFDRNGVHGFDVKAGPAKHHDASAPYSWTRSFPNASRLGQPDVFDFDDLSPDWVWI